MITDIYSKRLRRLRGEFPDVYQYDTIPQPLRVQIIHILTDFCDYVYDYEIADEDGYLVLNNRAICNHVHEILCREYGCFSLAGIPDSEDPNFNYDVVNVHTFFLDTEDVENVIDVIELSFQYIVDKILSSFDIESSETMATLNTHKKNVIEELNERFREHSVGYQYESGQIIRVDSQYVHSEVVHPVLRLLSDPMYQSPNEEFLKAHEHYRKGEYKSCISECSNAFESVLKIICDHRGWDYDEKATAKPLLEIVYNNELLPKRTKSFFSGVRSGLEHGVPIIRNKYSAHGQGNKGEPVPDYMVENMLNLTASSILLLVRANKNLA